MTNELAIRILTGDVLGTTEQTQEAITMAVRALSQPNVLDTNVGDTIYRRAAIDEILGQPPELHYPSWYAEQIKALPSVRSDLESAYAEGYTAAEADFHKLMDAQPRWIPIKKALPDDNKDVLVTVHFTRGYTESSYYVDLAYRLNDEWMSYSDDYLMVPKSRLEIIAWMPLPSPFKED